MKGDNDMMKKIKIGGVILLFLAFIFVMVYAVDDALSYSELETSAVTNSNKKQNEIQAEDVYNPVEDSIYIKIEDGKMTGYEVVDPNGNVIDSGDVNIPAQ